MLNPDLNQPPHFRLSPREEGTMHLFVTEGVGGTAASSMLAGASQDFLSRTVSLHMTGNLMAECLSPLNHPRLARVDSMGSLTGLMLRLQEIFSKGLMGMQLYIAGSECFVGQVIGLAIEYGLDADSISTEICGPPCRRVQCVHCKDMINDVTTALVQCPGCGLVLVVRDHFSRRLGAFMGVSHDAEKAAV